MLDIQKIREEKEVVKEALLKRMNAKELDLDKILELDENRRQSIMQLDNLKAERNKFSKTKPDIDTINKMKQVGSEVKQLEEKLNRYEIELNQRLSELPNIPALDVVAGGKENNKVLEVYKKKPIFKFIAKDHLELSKSLGLIDYERSAKISGAGFWTYFGDGALLEWALLNYFVEFHKKNKYQFIIPPFLLTEKSAFTSGHLPKFKDDLYWTQDKLCLNATSEMMLGNYHRDEVLKEVDLPLKYFAFSTCFRREAGTYGKDERGMIRGHQFNKVEMFQLTKPEDSWKAFDELLKFAQKLVEGLGLHFQTVQLAALDVSAAMAKTMDIEVWIPSMNNYKEVSSISNALDYQSRRGNIRYKKLKTGKNELVHTLNASGLATSRLLPAILEQYQQKDGSVKIPNVLQKFVGKKVIKK